jgi:hypothetical protein
MAWYWCALIIGIALPWLVAFKTMIEAFHGGLQFGLWTWLGISASTVPIIFALGYVVTMTMRLATSGS